jgi:capsular exopolysaccharide synthesis family protein
MSKFFEALEQAEQERAREEAAKGQRDREAAIERDFSARRVHQAAPAQTVAKVSPPHRRIARPPADAGFTSRHSNRDFDRAPRDGNLEDHLVSLLSPASAEAEQYRTLCCALEQAHRDANLHVVAVTSPGVGDGKTITSINLASTLSQTPETRVLLIDADLRHPSVASNLGMDEFDGTGLVDAILDPNLTLANVERRISSFDISVITAGRIFDSPYEALKSPRLETLMQEARGRYDYVIVDTPPVVPVPDCRVIARWVEGFLIVVAANQTPRKLLEETLNIVDPAKVVGLVFNRDDLPLSDYYGYAYATGSRSYANGGGWSERLARKFTQPPRATFPLAHK